MASHAAAAGNWRSQLRHVSGRAAAMAAGLLVLAFAIALAFALASYSSTDPALMTAAAGPVHNALGPAGAWGADLLLTMFGLSAVLLVPPLIVVALRLWRGVDPGQWKRALSICVAAMLLCGTGLALVHVGGSSALPAGPGGGFGLTAASLIDPLLARLQHPWAVGLRIASVLLFGVFGITMALWSLGLDGEERAAIFSLRRRVAADAPAAVRRPPQASAARVVREAADPAADPVPPARTTIAVAAKPAAPSARTQRERQAKLDLGDTWVLPTLDLLAPPPAPVTDKLDKAALERNARLLETVLEDFHVRGHVTEVRPGPVVTMYELEPAAGIKASRVVALADDIARNMSALSARVATVPGRTVIGIELPNQKRESVVLSELIASQQFEHQSPGNLALILGKNIGGDAVIADLAPMPHLLVAGTTGSGKSVGLNAMILSLLYRLTPDQCRMIMIDPKMLELSVYDDIPHLLSPVVTEPAKAIRALKWAVEQMEDRYRMMATIQVRGLASFNDKVRSAKAKGQPLGRRVQTGYDADTGQPTYEEEKLEYEPLPMIVVVVDELADLMMTAGKEVEFLIQRLAQKARAAGIHLIMATQRPSVDVITGVIKANLPTRISFQVASKIDSRTILNEQGAEQLLGKGDMLYVAGGKQIVRVHGPFVSDDEVRAVAEHWKAQRAPEYVSAVTEEPLEGSYTIEGAPTGPDDPETQTYRKAVQLVVENRKASTSWLQRQLRVGYNGAARLIERMEKAGIISTPDHVGRREVLIEPSDLPSYL
jgi:DNA segregation ATPase FtsK/SpoIIIE, S-DNA-T family